MNTNKIEMKRIILMLILIAFGSYIYAQSGVIRRTQTAKVDTLSTHIEYLNWVAFVENHSTGGAGTPGGSSGDIQYNNSGAFGGFGDYDGTTLSAESDILAHKYITANAAAQSTSGTINFDTRDNADSETITITNTSTLNINYIEDGQEGIIEIRQDATGSRTLAIATFSDNATTGLTETYSGGLQNIQPTASTYTWVKYKRLGSRVKIDLIWVE